MNIDQVTQLVQSALRGSGFSLFLPADNEFTSTLNIGQIIKGRVLRHYEGGRHLVDFGGYEKVVDSSVPLKTNEVIHGRVVALGERVELQRVAIDGTALKTAGESATAIAGDGQGYIGRNERLIQNMFDRYQVRLSASDQASLLQNVRQAAEPGIMVMAGMVLSKLGMSQSPELLQALYHALTQRPQQRGMFHETVLAAELMTSEYAESRSSVAQDLAAILSERVQQITEKDMQKTLQADHNDITKTAVSSDTANDSARNDMGQSFWNMGRWLLNAQSHGSVSHRIMTIPFLLGDKLVEVDVAMFDQKQTSATDNSIRHRQIVFSLNLDSLGHVEIVANVANQHVRLAVSTEKSEATDYLARYMNILKKEMEQAGWTLDELAYETKGQDWGGVNQAVVEHYITQDSLSRLM